MNKLIADADAAVALIPDGASILMGGFGVCGIPEHLIRALHRRGTRNLTIINGYQIVARCTLPMTGLKVVHTIVTDRAVIDVTPQGLLLREIAADTTVDAVRAATGAPLLVTDPVGIFD
jgi:acyl CoA:acetate/3-ketoacid CoA transferase alpha subunit